MHEKKESKRIYLTKQVKQNAILKNLINKTLTPILTSMRIHLVVSKMRVSTYSFSQGVSVREMPIHYAKKKKYKVKCQLF